MTTTDTNTAQALADECKRLHQFVLHHKEQSERHRSGSDRYLAHMDHVRIGTERLHETLARLASLASQAAEPTMADAVAAGDGTLHGAIDYWQQRAQAAEQEPVATSTRCEIVRGCHECQHVAYDSSGYYRCVKTSSRFDTEGKPRTPPAWCPLPFYASAAPVRAAGK